MEGLQPANVSDIMAQEKGGGWPGGGGRVSQEVTVQLKEMMSSRFLLFSVPFLLLSSCSEAPKPEVKKEPPKPAEAVSGRDAFFKMYAPARTWAPDIQPMRLRSIDIPDVKSHDGKYGAWEAVFVSDGR